MLDYPRKAYHHAMLNEQQIHCPYCGETFTGFIDVSQGNHNTVEDCYVCCRPIELRITVDNYAANSDDGVRVDSFSDDETAF